MKKIAEFLKTTLIGGLFVLLPLVLLHLLLSELLQLVVQLATPLADLFPKGTFDETRTPVVFALVLIVAASFLFGLALRFAVLKQLGRRLESSILDRIPLYGAVKSLARGLVGSKDAAFQTAILSSPNGDRELVYVIEHHEDGQVTVLTPTAPAGFAGRVRVVAPERLEQLDASLGDASKVLGQWGMGLRKLMAARTQSG